MSRYEADKENPSDDVKVKIARHFKISLDYFMGTVDDPLPLYQKTEFIKIPNDATDEELFMITEVLGYIDYRRKI